MLAVLMIVLENELTTSRDREAVKRLFALIRAKRALGKQAPGAKAVGKMLAHLESKGTFDRSEGSESGEKADS